jgi:hypothetical protein
MIGLMQSKRKCSSRNAKCVSTDSDAGDFILRGCNVHVENGSGSTPGYASNPKGNLVIGYNEDGCGRL